jgi:hypothetical protein
MSCAEQQEPSPARIQHYLFDPINFTYQVVAWARLSYSLSASFQLLKLLQRLPGELEPPQQNTAGMRTDSARIKGVRH